MTTKITTTDKRKWANQILTSNSNTKITDDFSIYWLSQEQGLYVALTLVKTTYYVLTIDLANKNFQIEGITGKVLKNNNTNLQKVLGHGVAFQDNNCSNLDPQTAKMFRELAHTYGAMGDLESENQGRGIYRLIKEFPVAEQLYKEYGLNSANATSDAQRILTSLNQTKFDTAFRMTKAERKYYRKFPRVLKDNIHSIRYYTNRVEENPDDLEQAFANQKAQIKNYLFVYSVARQVDKERGYNLSFDWFKGWVNYWTRNSWRYEEYVNNFEQDLAILQDTGKQHTKKRSRQNAIKYLVRYLYGSCYLQQGMSFDQAISTLHDYYQLTAPYGKITRYPRYLATAHDVAVFNHKFTESEDDTIKVYRAYKKYHEFEGANNDYTFLLTRSAKDIVTEGNQQHNCVGSYIRNVTSGRSLIFSMRKTGALDESCITVELRFSHPDNQPYLAQAFASCNVALNSNQEKALFGWCEANGIKYGHDYTGSKFHSDELKYTKFKSSQAIPEEERNTALVELDELLAKRENSQKIINPKIISA